MTVGAWRDDLQLLPPVGPAIVPSGYSIPADVVLPGGYVNVPVQLTVEASIRPALFGDNVTPDELFGIPYSFVEVTTGISYYKNNPYNTPVWTGSVQLPTPPDDGPATSVINSENFGAGVNVGFRIFYEAPNFPAVNRVTAAASGLRFRLRELISSVFVTLGPSAGYPEPYVPSGYRLEWEYSTAEFIGVYGAACSGLGAPLSDQAEWYAPSPDAFRPLEPGEHADAGNPLTPSAPLGNAWGTWWAGGSKARGSSISVATGPSGPWGLLAGTDLADPALLPDLYTAVAAPRILRGAVTPGDLPISGDRPAQWLALKPLARARRYRLVGLSGVRQYPRDDGAGLSSPRVSTSQRPTRIAGGYR